jgi:gamma-tubulin complex component 5
MQVIESKADVDLASIWQDRYLLRKTPDGTLHAPKFLQNLAAQRIFTTGKSVVILQNLGRFDLLASSRTIGSEIRFDDVCDSTGLSLIPFSELFNVAIDNWVQSRHHTASTMLRSCLFTDCGLRVSLQALENIFFMQDGATAGVLANSLSDKLSNGNSNWNDRFTVTELAHSTMGTLAGVATDRLRVAFSGKKYDDVLRARRTVKSLGSLTFMYSIPWPVQIVITKDTVSTYQKIFTFLLQIRHSTHMLATTRLLRDEEKLNSGADERALFYLVRSRLLWFTSTLYNHLTEVAIEINTLKMHQSLRDAGDVDQMVLVHATYMKNLADQTLLSAKLEPIQHGIISILDLSIKLSDARDAHAGAQALYQSSLLSTKGATPATHTKRRRETLSSDDEGDDSEADMSMLIAGAADMSYIDQLRTIKAQFDQLGKFVSTGLRAVARAGDQGSWNMLAEKLELGSS